MNGGTKYLFAYAFAMILLSLPCSAFAQAQANTTPGSSGGGQAAASGDDAIYCRRPEQRTDSRMMGPRVCMPLGKWKELRAKGLDVSADGQSYQQLQNSPTAGSMGTSYGLSPQ